MRHPRLVLAVRAHPTVGNEAGMCPGINRFTKCAPIADWVRRGVPLWCSRVGSGGAPVVGPGTTALRVETRKMKIRKTNLECALESTAPLFGILTSPCRLGCAG